MLQQPLHRRVSGEYITVARPTEGGWTYDRPRWFRGFNFRMTGITAQSPEFVMHSHPPSGLIGPSSADWFGSSSLNVMGMVVHTGERTMTFYWQTPTGDRLAPVTIP